MRQENNKFHIKKMKLPAKLRKIMYLVPIMLLCIWIVLWINFIARDLYKKKRLREYKSLLASNADQKHSLTYGEHFYEFLKLSEEQMPENSYYDFVGIKELSLAWRRGVYFLYPKLMKPGAEYILVYDELTYRKDGYRVFAKLDEKRYILKKW